VSLIRQKLLTLGTCGLVSLLWVRGDVFAQSSDASGLARVFPGEYVVTLPAQGALVSQDVGALAATGQLDKYGTILRGLNSRTVLIGSSWRPASSAISGTVSSLSATLRTEDLFCKTLLARKVVTSCTPNYELRASEVTVNDPYSDNLWGLNNDTGISARRAWDVSTGSSDVVVAIVDTGIDYNHPDLAANVWVNPGETAGNGVDDDGNGFIDDIHGVNTVLGAANRGNPMDDNEHGTHVAGTIGAVGDNGEGVVGINHTVKLMGLKFMDASGAGRLSDAIAAIDYMVSMKVNHGVNIRVSNNSWGGGGYSPALLAAIDRARVAGIAFVAAAGNSRQDTDLFPSYPSSYEVANVVSVAAIDTTQGLASFSNYGAESVDIAAPGVGIFSTLPSGRYGYLSGTSMATPHASGALGLLFAAEPGLSLEQAIERLYETGRHTASLVNANGDVLVRTRRVVDAGRLLLNQREPLPPADDGLPACGYDFETKNLAKGGGIDTSADTKPIVNQNDEGGYYRVNLPFEFPFFRTKTSTLYVSPNGVVYLNEPTASDYQIAQRAPNNSIAAFQSDLIPRAAKQGVRVATHSDRVTVAWSSEHYALLGSGPVTVRLTLFKSGVIHDSISFDSTTNPVQMSRFLLGNPFSTPTGTPLGLVGVAATSSRLSSTLDLAATQMQLVDSESDPLNLGVAMLPNCFQVESGGTVEPVSVSKLRVRLARDRKSVSLDVSGVGTGKVSMTATVNGVACSQAAWTSLSSGKGSHRLPVPRGVGRVSFKAGAARAGTSVSPVRRRTSKQEHLRLCSRVLKPILSATAQ
jgi:hypothetical protein